MVYQNKVIYLSCFIICVIGAAMALGEKNYGQYCSGYVDRSCNQTKYLICVDKRCECRNPATMIYDKVSDLCVTALGSPCYQEGFFLTSPKGYKDSTKFYQGIKYEKKTQCGPNAICDEITRTCICQNPQDSGTNGTCSKPPIGEFICDFDHMVCPARSGLKCVDGTCQCRYPNLQYFNGTRCISRVGGPCERPPRFEVAPNVQQKDSGLHCTPFAECVLEGRHHRCVCLRGYTQNQLGQCLPGYGQRCKFGNQCGSENDLLKCVDGTCQCPDDLHTYDTTEMRCRGLVGAYCQMNTAKEERVTRSGDSFCVNHAFCKPNMYRATVGVCACESGAVEIQNGTCDNQYMNDGW